jgi:hypothetical protein
MLGTPFSCSDAPTPKNATAIGRSSSLRSRFTACSDSMPGWKIGVCEWKIAPSSTRPV